MSEKAERTREKILDTAIKHFLRDGFSGASLRSIVKDAGLTTGAFYKYYPTKEMLFDALIDPYIEHIYEIYDEIIDDFEKLSAHDQTNNMSNAANDGTNQMIDYIYENKTSALIEASVMTGAILGGATEEETAIVEKAAKNIGLAFQIQDDILDVTSTEEELGKPIHSDEKNHKTTYVTLMGIEKASQQVKKLSDEAVTLFEGLNKKNEFLFTLVNELVGRRK